MVTLSQIEFTRITHELKTISRRDITQGIKLAKFKKSACGMLKKDPAAANTLLGLVACLEHDMAGMHEYHKKAIGTFESCISLMYYSVSLEQSCLWNESARYALSALDHDPDNRKVLDSLINLAPLTGRFSLLKRLLLHWQEVNDGAPHKSHGDCEIVGDILSRNGLLEKDLKVVVTAIGDALSETDVILRKFHSDRVMERNDPAFIHYRFVVPDQFVASYYEDLISARLDSLQCHPRIFDAFSFSVENSTVHELYACMDKELDDSADTIRVPDPEKMKLIEELVEGVEI